MRAMILAAGRGERMRPLTDTTPKPLLPVGGRPLIAWHVAALVRAGITELIVNHAWLGQRIEDYLGDGSRFGARIQYSAESPALETAGGIAQALPYFQDQPFLVVNGDIWTDWNPASAFQAAQRLASLHARAWLLLTDNPLHHAEGDFILGDDGVVRDKNAPPLSDTLTFTGVGLYKPDLFADLTKGRPTPLAPLLRNEMQAHRVIGTRHSGAWVDVGTPERLAALDERLRSQYVYKNDIRKQNRLPGP